MLEQIKQLLKPREIEFISMGNFEAYKKWADQQEEYENSLEDEE